MIHAHTAFEGKSPEEFTSYIVTIGQSYLNLESSDSHTTIQFTGPFHGALIIWYARIQTLEHTAASFFQQYPDKREIHLRPYIQIGNTNSYGRHLTVALPVPRIDATTIQKTLIMIRKYKLLREGKHEFGKSCAFRAIP